MATAQAGGPAAVEAARQAGAMAVGRDTNRAEQAFRLASELAPLDAAPRIALSHLRASMGDLDAARREAGQAFAAAVDESQRADAAFALAQFAERRGDRSEARDAYTASLRLAEAVAKNDRADFASNLAVAEARQRLAELDFIDGEHDAAKTGHEAALQMFRALSIQRPKDPSLLAGEACSEARLADLALGAGDTNAASAHSLAARIACADLADIGDPELDEALAALGQLDAEIALRGGDLDQAKRAMEDALSRRVRRAAADPDARAPLLGAWRKQAELYSAAGQLDLAAAARRQALALAETLHKENRRDEEAASNLIAAIIESGDAATDPETARQAYARAVQMANQRAVAKPDDPARIQTLAVAWSRLGEVGLEAGRPEGAADAFARAAHFFRQRANAAPDDITAKRLLAGLLLKLGDARIAAKHGDALEPLRESLRLRLELSDASKGDVGALRDLAVGLERVGLAARDAGDVDTARRSFEDELGLAERIFKQRTPDALRFMAIVHGHLATLPTHSAQAHRMAALEALDTLAIQGALGQEDQRLRGQLRA